MASAKRKARKSRQGRKRRNQISEEDVPELLTWLEYSKGSETGERFKENAVNHFRDYLGKTISFEQIDVKIGEIWDKHRHGEAKNFSSHKCLYRLGTSGLSGVTEDWKMTKRQIRHRVMQLQLGTARKIPLANSVVDELPIVSTPTKSKPVKVVECHTPVPVGVRFGFLQESDPQQRVESDGSELSKLNCRLSEVPQTPITTEHLSASPRDTPDKPHSSSSLSDSDMDIDSIDVSITSDEDYLEVDVKPTNHSSFWRPNFESLYQDDYPCSNHLCRRKIKTLGDALSTTNEGLAILKQSFGNAAKEVNEEIVEVSAELAKCRTQIIRLESIIRDKQRNTSFTTLLAVRNFRLDSRPLERKMEELHVAMQQGLSFEHAEMYEPCTEIPLVISTELSALLRRAVGRHDEIVQRMELRTLVRALISASVCIWVLESRLTDECFQSTPIFEECMSVLGLHDGREAVRNLHFIANTRLIESEHFQANVVPAKAAILARRLIQVLKAVFLTQKPLDQWKFDVLTNWEEQEPHLRKVFSAALQVKAQAMISRAVFEIDLPQSGTQFIQDQMNLPGSITMLENPRVPKGSVLVSLVPGLRIFAADPDIVDYNSFREPGSEPGAKFDQIRKPLVLVE